MQEQNEVSDPIFFYNKELEFVEECLAVICEDAMGKLQKLDKEDDVLAKLKMMFIVTQMEETLGEFDLFAAAITKFVNPNVQRRDLDQIIEKYKKMDQMEKVSSLTEKHIRFTSLANENIGEDSLNENDGVFSIKEMLRMADDLYKKCLNILGEMKDMAI